MTTENVWTGVVVCLFVPAMAWIMVAIVRWAATQGDVNAAAGIRLPSLMRSPAAWSAGHRASVPPFLWSAVLTTVPALLAATAALARADVIFVALLLVASVALTLGSTLGVVVAHRAAVRVADD